MIIQLESKIQENQLDQLKSKLSEIGYKGNRIQTQYGDYVVSIGKKDFDIRSIGTMPGVKDIHRVSDAYKLVSKKWKDTEGLTHARRDTLITIFLGGMVSMAIAVAAAAIPAGEVQSAMDLAQGLEPLFGNAARYSMGIGLFAAGLTSAITAPMAAAYVAANCLGWPPDLKHPRSRWVWTVVLLAGVLP